MGEASQRDRARPRRARLSGAPRPPAQGDRGDAQGAAIVLAAADGLNNVAIAARHALEVRGLARVAVIDFDVHHGNGTEAAFAGDERVLMCSFFQHPFYPFSGAENQAANMVNLPMAARTPGAAVREAIDLLWLPRLETFKPEMIFISAGFDAHREDDLGNLGLVEDDYAWITDQIRRIAARYAHGRIVSCLEGGYNLSALGRSVVAHVRALAGI